MDETNLEKLMRLKNKMMEWERVNNKKKKKFQSNKRPAGNKNRKDKRPIPSGSNSDKLFKGNYGLFFYKKMYDSIYKEKKQSDMIKKMNEVLQKSLDSELIALAQSYDDFLSYESDSLYSFQLVTTYPGLFIGGGYLHGLKDVNDFKLGFYFDYTTGLPVIPGSSIKGLLRSAFGGNKGRNKKHIEKYTEEKQAYIAELLGLELTGELVEELKNQIFEGIDAKGQPLEGPRDIFFDAFPILEEEKPFLGDDYITPHIKDYIDEKKGYVPNEESALENPTPIRFLKVLPGVKYKFQFFLRDTELSNGQLISKEKKLELFKAIILEYGLGAKTRVGYGQFIEDR